MVGVVSRRAFAGSCVVAGLLASSAVTASAQVSGAGIAGVVRDTTGAVMPGVTVEASSPVLIEKVRSAATDNQGLYRIIDLRPGVYTVTFTLPGFVTFKRDGIELTANFTATIDAEMRVGGVEESITVSGQSPVVDVQNVIQQKVMTRDVIDAVPSGQGNYVNLGVLVPGMITNSQDVGGTSDNGPLTLRIHGGRAQDGQLQVDGLAISNGFSAGGANVPIYVNNGIVQEIVIEDGGGSAEHELAGVRSNLIPKDGGNMFAGRFSASYTNSGLQSDNLDEDLRAQGLTTVNSVEKIWDVNPSFGGPLKQDNLWFYASYRNWGAHTQIAGMYWDTDVRDNVWTPDLSRPAVAPNDHWSGDLRLTWQANEKNKFTAFWNPQYSGFGAGYTVTNASAREGVIDARFVPNYVLQTSWTSPLTNRLLLSAAGGLVASDSAQYPQDSSPNDLSSLTERRTSFNYRVVPQFGHRRSNNYRFRGAASYVTGSHNLKIGFDLAHTWNRETREVVNALNLQLLDGVPSRVVVWALPINWHETMKYNLGIYGQDQWTVNRLTLSLGVRADFLNAYIPATQLEAGPFIAARSFAEVKDAPNWKDVSPRIGANYNLTGNGKTSLKFALGRYVVGGAANFARPVNPVEASATSTTRTWTDRNGNFSADCDFREPNLNGECGRNDNLNFGNANPNATQYDTAYSQGFGKRASNWNFSASVQQEVRPGVAVGFGYFRRWYSNFTSTDNLLVVPDDYDPFCITPLPDPRLPDGGGNQLCGLYDVDPTKFGQIKNLITRAENFGVQEEVYDGFDVTTSMRLPRRVNISGGLNFGHTVTDACFTVDSPQALLYCRVSPPFQPQVKFAVVYPLPWWDIQTSATIQSIAGPEITASYTVTNAEALPTLGRPLSGGTATVPLVSPGTMYGERLNQVDYRMSKLFRVGGVRLMGNFDLYNLFNNNTVLTVNNNYGPAWQRPTSILAGRLIKFGVQVDF